MSKGEAITVRYLSMTALLLTLLAIFPVRTLAGSSSTHVPHTLNDQHTSGIFSLNASIPHADRIAATSSVPTVSAHSSAIIATRLGTVHAAAIKSVLRLSHTGIKSKSGLEQITFHQ